MAKIAGVENAAGLGAIAEMYAPQSASAEVEASLVSIGIPQLSTGTELSRISQCRPTSMQDR